MRILAVIIKQNNLVQNQPGLEPWLFGLKSVNNFNVYVEKYLDCMGCKIAPTLLKSSPCI